MTQFTTFFTDLLGQFHRLPVAVVLGAFILAIGLLIKGNHVIPNNCIPWVTVALGTFGYAGLGNAQAVTCVTPGFRQYLVLGVYGAILGFVVWGAHRFLLRRLEKYLPDGFFPVGSFDTDPPFPPPTQKESELIQKSAEARLAGTTPPLPNPSVGGGLIVPNERTP